MTAISSPAKAAGGGGGGGGGGGSGVGGGGSGGGSGGGGSPTYCFLQGTHILTPRGELPIEDLRIGDLVRTVRGEAMPIKWIGRHTYKKSGASWPKSIMPIRVSCGAIDEQTPCRDLYLGPEHALFIDGFLMPVKDLANGASIAPAIPSGRDAIEYFQIVLDTHEVILAEGAPAETLLMASGGKYESFTNFIEYERLYGTEPHCTMAPFAPHISYSSGRGHLKALLRLGASSLIGIGLDEPLEKAYSRIAARAREMAV